MSELVGGGSKYTDEQRREAAVRYAITGNMQAIERELSIPRTTMLGWKESEWWQQLVDEVRHENQDKHIARYHELTSESLDLALSGLQMLKGQSLTASDIKALVVTGATATDKARLLLNQPTSIRGDNSSVQALADQFKHLSQQWNEKQANVVSVQVPEDKG